MSEWSGVVNSCQNKDLSDSATEYQYQSDTLIGSGEYNSDSETLIPSPHLVQPKRSSVSYVSRRYSLSSDPHFSSNATSHPIVTILEEDPTDCDYTTENSNNSPTTLPAAVLEPLVIKEFIPREQLAHQVKSQPYYKQIRSELELTASEPGILERIASPLLLGNEEGASQIESESLQSVDSFATDEALKEEEGFLIASDQQAAYISSASEEFYYPDSAGDLDLKFEIMESHTENARRDKRRRSTAPDVEPRSWRMVDGEGTADPTAISYSTYEHVAAGHRSPPGYRSVTGTSSNPAGHHSPRGYTASPQPQPHPPPMKQRQSMVTAADVDLGFTGGGYSTNGFIDSTVSVGTVVSPGLQNRYDNVMDELSEKQGRVSPRKIKEILRGSVYTDVEMQRFMSDVATQYDKEDFEEDPETHFIVGAFSFICCPVFAILSMRASLKVKDLMKENDKLLARKYSQQSLCLSMVALFLGMFIYIVTVYIGVNYIPSLPLYKWF